MAALLTSGHFYHVFLMIFEVVVYIYKGYFIST
jgi:hypothetical protein